MVYHLGTQVVPELDVLVESDGEVGFCPFCISVAGEGGLRRVEMQDGPRHSKFHGVELFDEALQLLDGYAPLSIGYRQKGD